MRPGGHENRDRSRSWIRRIRFGVWLVWWTPVPHRSSSFFLSILLRWYQLQRLRGPQAHLRHLWHPLACGRRKSAAIPDRIDGMLPDWCHETCWLANPELNGGYCKIARKIIPSGKPLHNELENHHCWWENPRTKWLFSIAMFDITRGYFPGGFPIDRRVSPVSPRRIDSKSSRGFVACRYPAW